MIFSSVKAGRCRRNMLLPGTSCAIEGWAAEKLCSCTLRTVGYPAVAPPGMTRKPIVGTWLSLVERTLGVGEVASSNLVVPTIYFRLFAIGWARNSSVFPVIRQESEDSGSLIGPAAEITCNMGKVTLAMEVSRNFHEGSEGNVAAISHGLTMDFNRPPLPTSSDIRFPFRRVELCQINNVRRHPNGIPMECRSRNHGGCCDCSSCGHSIVLKA